MIATTITAIKKNASTKANWTFIFVHFYNKNIWIHNFFYFNVFINAMSNTKRELKLSFSKNWNVWLSIVRVKIIKYSIWKLIDFSKEIKSTSKLKFIKFDLNTQENDNFTKKHVKYKIVFFKYKKKLQNWKKQKNFMTKIINHIVKNLKNE